MTPADRKIALRERFLLYGPDGREVQPYSLRHTTARELQSCGVPHDQIEITMEHSLPVGHSPTTKRYAPYDPSYCREAAQAIDRIMINIQDYTRHQIVPEQMVAVPGQKVKDNEVRETRLPRRQSEKV